jgi:opacity protein-like surface antigen
MRCLLTCCLSALIFLLFSASSFAEEPKSDAPVYVHDYKPDTQTTLPQNSPFISLRLNAGTFRTNGNPKLSNQSGGYAFGFEMDVLPAELISYRLELITASRTYDTNIPPPGFGTVSGRMTLDTSALILGVRCSYPPRKSYRLYATAGIGYFKNKLWADSSLFGIPGEVSDEDSSLGYDAGGGVEFDLGNWVLGVNYRRWFVSASFSTFGISGADIGGDYLGLSVGWLFR